MADGLRIAKIAQATVEALQRALDRATREAKQSVPNTKYMALLDKKKALTKQLAALQGSAAVSERTQAEHRSLELRCANLEVRTSGLKPCRLPMYSALSLLRLCLNLFAPGRTGV